VADEEGAANVQRPEPDQLFPVDAEGAGCLGVPVGEELLGEEEAALSELLGPDFVGRRRVVRESVDANAVARELR